jgi:hypothetical protein
MDYAMRLKCFIRTMRLKYFIRTIGDNHGLYEDMLTRAVSKEDYEESAISDLSGQVFSVNVNHLAISLVYRGKCERYFEHDVCSEAVDGRRQMIIGSRAALIRMMMAREKQDEAWINLSKMNICFAVIHRTNNANKEKICFARTLLDKNGIPCIDIECKEFNPTIAKLDINRCYIGEIHGTIRANYGRKGKAKREVCPA